MRLNKRQIRLILKKLTGQVNHQEAKELKALRLLMEDYLETGRQA